MDLTNDLANSAPFPHTIPGSRAFPGHSTLRRRRRFQDGTTRPTFHGAGKRNSAAAKSPSLSVHPSLRQRCPPWEFCPSVRLSLSLSLPPSLKRQRQRYKLQRRAPTLQAYLPDADGTWKATKLVDATLLAKFLRLRHLADPDSEGRSTCALPNPICSKAGEPRRIGVPNYRFGDLLRDLNISRRGRSLRKHVRGVERRRSARSGPSGAVESGGRGGEGTRDKGREAGSGRTGARGRCVDLEVLHEGADTPDSTRESREALACSAGAAPPDSLGRKWSSEFHVRETDGGVRHGQQGSQQHQRAPAGEEITYFRGGMH